MEKHEKALFDYLKIIELADELTKKINFEREWIEERQDKLKDLREFNKQTRLKLKEKKAEYEKILEETNKLDLEVNNDKL